MSPDQSDEDPPAANPFLPRLLINRGDIDACLNDPETIRNNYIKRETAIRTIAILYLLGAVLGIFLTIFTALQVITGDGSDNRTAYQDLGVNLSAGVVAGVLGFGLRTLKGWARSACIGLSWVGVTGAVLRLNPISLAINITMLCLLYGRRSSYVCSSEYRAICDQASHLNRKTATVIRVLCALVVLEMVGLLAVAIVGIAYKL